MHCSYLSLGLAHKSLKLPQSNVNERQGDVQNV